MAHGEFCWNELTSHDVEAAKRFYAETVGWTYDGMPMDGGGTYWIAKSGDKPVAGLMDAALIPLPKEVPEHWTSYLEVDDVDARCARAKQAGATIIREPFDVPQAGRIAIVRQPGGGMVGWMTPAPM